MKTINSLKRKPREIEIIKKAPTEEEKRKERQARDERRAKKKPHRASEHQGPTEGAINKVGSNNNYMEKKKRADKKRKSTEPYEPKSLEKKTRAKSRPKVAPKVEEPEINLEDYAPGTKIINVPITVAGFAEQTEMSTSQIIMGLMKMGVMANINQNLDEDTAQLLADELGISIVIGEVEEDIVEEGLDLHEDKDEDLQKRAPIITVMGHVDHGKTSLLDAIRSTSVTKGEAGGITQHIGASEVQISGEKIVFLDTPGHEAFTAMRARGAHITDIAVLVVAADDGVMPQTVESISHAKAAGVPIIVAVNKIDKPGANLDRVYKELADHHLIVEAWGGDIISVPLSAKTGEGVTDLLEMILLQAEVLELKANPNRLAQGTVIEARLDKSKGSVSTLLVLNGTLEAGDSIVAGTTSGRIRAMHDFKGKKIRKAGPATAVEITGLTEVPQAGDTFNAVKEDKVARSIAEARKIKQRDEVMLRTSHTSLESFFSQLQEGEIKELNLIIKGDVQGSVGAVTTSLEKLKNENAKVNIIHTGVGAITESDVMLASTSDAIIIGFNVRPSTAVTTLADSSDVEIRTYRVIYDIIGEVESALKGMLDPEYREVVLGKIEIRETFKVPGVGVIGGSYVLEGKVERNAEIRLVRDGIVIHEGKISSLRRFKDDVREVAQGYECGIGIEKYNDIKEGDIIEAFKMEEIERA
ncbi:MAG: translation initiation factor IF-2 [Clostridiales Family XIII bacterium]|nr:translation initiation factor IF-2 [Clostridiales Family XIII bacterium]